MAMESEKKTKNKNDVGKTKNQGPTDGQYIVAPIPERDLQITHNYHLSLSP